MSKHSTYLSRPMSLANLEQKDRNHYERARQGSEELRRAMMRYYYKRNGWTS